MQRLPSQRTVWCAESASPALHRNPADALEAHVSNAIDENIKAKLDGTAHQGRLGRSVRRDGPGARPRDDWGADFYGLSGGAAGAYR
jgi:hypothetical protein